MFFATKNPKNRVLGGVSYYTQVKRPFKNRISGFLKTGPPSLGGTRKQDKGGGREERESEKEGEESKQAENETNKETGYINRGKA